MVLYLHSPIARGSFTFAHLYSPVDYVYQTQQSKMVGPVLVLVFSPAEVAGTAETGTTRYFMCSGLLAATISKGGLW
jgi:hypothetical protein